MLHSPPNPGLQASIGETVRALRYVPVDEVLGTLDGHILTVESAGPGAVRWILLRDLPDGLAPRLLSRRAYDALREGEVTPSGIVRGGRTWHLCDRWDGQRLYADLAAE